MTRAASGSAHHQPAAAFSTSPASTATARIPSTSVTRPSVISTGLPSARPVRALPAPNRIFERDRILELLLNRQGRLVGSAQILTSVWGLGFQQRTKYLRFHMARLRRKLEDNPARLRHLLTEPGMGYRYQP